MFHWLAVFFVHVCLCIYLLDILLEHTQLQPLVQSDLSMLPNVLETPLMVEDLVNHIQDAMNLRNNSKVNSTAMFWNKFCCTLEGRDGTDRFGVIGSGCQRIRVAGTQRPLEDVQQGFAVLTHLEKRTVWSQRD